MKKKRRGKQFLVRKLKKALRKISEIRLRGVHILLNYPDRLVLEDIIFPYFLSKADFQRYLFVGCDWYTKAYNSWFKRREFWTIDCRPEKRKYGSKNHVVDNLENLGAHFHKEYFEIIFCNGVIGWGMNTKEAVEESLNQCYQALRPGGILVLGWNDLPQYRPFNNLGECDALKRFERYFFEPLSGSQYLTPNTWLKHTFSFYKKPE